MRATEHVQHRFNRWGIVLSVLLHGFVCTVVLLMPSPSPNPAVQEGAVNVEIVASTPKDIQQKQKPPPLARGEIQPKPAEPNVSPPNISEQTLTSDGGATEKPPKARSQDSEPKFVKPTHMLSDAVLADRRSRQARQELKQLAPAEQIEQLCNLEAMSQVGVWNKELQPDRIVAYAMADTKVSGSDFVAAGAALHSKRDWYRLQFKCKLNEDKQKVAAFEFRLGDVIPRDIWAEHNIPDEDGASD